jgi:hypothetical protein
LNTETGSPARPTRIVEKLTVKLDAQQLRHDSFTLDASGRPIALGDTRLKLPTIGWVSTYEGLPHITTKAFTMSEEAGSW